MTLRRYAPLKPSRGTVWPPEVKAHVRSHYAGCLGPLAGMKGECLGQIELDHVRASGGTGMKSKSVAVNAAQLCSWHHRLRTEHGKEWRPRLITVINTLTRDCLSCEAERFLFYGSERTDYPASVA